MSSPGETPAALFCATGASPKAISILAKLKVNQFYLSIQQSSGVHI
jgi:hypothetical protein